MDVKEEAVLLIQADDNTRIIASKLNSVTDLNLTDDPIIQKIMNEADDKGKLTENEMDALLGGNN